MTKEELKNYIREQVKELDREKNEEEDDYTEGRIEGSKYVYLDLLDMGVLRRFKTQEEAREFLRSQR